MQGNPVNAPQDVGKGSQRAAAPGGTARRNSSAAGKITKRDRAEPFLVRRKLSFHAGGKVSCTGGTGGGGGGSAGLIVAQTSYGSPNCRKKQSENA